MIDNAINPALLSDRRRLTATKRSDGADRVFDALRTMKGVETTKVAVPPELAAQLGQYQAAAQLKQTELPTDTLEKVPLRRTTMTLKAVVDEDEDTAKKECDAAAPKSDGAAKKFLKLFGKKR